MAINDIIRSAAPAAQAIAGGAQPVAPTRNPTVTEADLAAGVPANANIVKRVPAPSGQGELLLDANGGVYDTGGQSFSGSYFSLTPEQRQGSRSFQDLVVDPKTGGYKLVSDKGEGYDFGPSQYVRDMPRANPLYSDPAFLAFVANAGMDYETAASQVTRQKAGLQNALTLTTGDIQKQGKKQLESIYKDVAGRGLTGAGQMPGEQAVREGEAQSDTLASIARAQADTANQITDLEGQLVTNRQNYLRDATTKGYDSAGRQFLDEKLKDVDKRYPLGAETGLKY